MLAIVIIVRKIEALTSPCGYWFNNCIIAIASWINAVIIGSHFLLSSFSRVSPSYTLYTLYYVQKQLFILIFTNKKLPTGRAWKRIPIRHLQSNTNYPISESWKSKTNCSDISSCFNWFETYSAIFFSFLPTEST